MASEAYLRVRVMGARFDKTEPGRFQAALWTCVQNTCLDFGRKELRHERRAAGSLDATYDVDGEAGPYDGFLTRYDEDLRRREEDAADAERSRVEAGDMIAFAIARVANDGHREMLELTWLDKLTSEEVSERLDISMANVYARRSRGGKELERILRDLRS